MVFDKLCTKRGLFLTRNQVIQGSLEKLGIRFSLQGRTGKEFSNEKPKTLMNVANTQIQMRKGLLEFCILNIISRGEVYTSDLIDELTRAEMIVVEGTLYPLLNRLKEAELLSYRWVESESGPPRKYYSITEEGKKFLDILSETWTSLVNSTSKITSTN
jgi:PadR family transcriptional regulator PadR